MLLLMQILFRESFVFMCLVFSALLHNFVKFQLMFGQMINIRMKL